MLVIIVDFGLAMISILAALLCAWFGVKYAQHDAVSSSSESSRPSPKYMLQLSLLLAAILGWAVYDIYSLAKGRFVRWELAVMQLLLFVVIGCVWRLVVAGRRRAHVLRLADEGQYEQAVEIATGMMNRRRHPDPDLHELLGLVHLNSGRPELAADEFRRSMELSQNGPGYMCDLAIALQRLGQIDEALALLDEACNRDPNRAGMYLHNKCFFLAEAGRTAEARKLLPEVERFHGGLAHSTPLESRQMDQTLARIQELCARDSTGA
jgi:tetratricopeptide (TPR) repeat protein